MAVPKASTASPGHVNARLGLSGLEGDRLNFLQSISRGLVGGRVMQEDSIFEAHVAQHNTYAVSRRSEEWRSRSSEGNVGFENR